MLTLLRKLPFLLLLPLLLGGCSTRKNNKYTRWYHGFTTRYNGYYHAEKKYNEQVAAINDRIAIPGGKDFAEFYLLLAPGNHLVEQADADVFLNVAKRCENLIAKHSVSKPPRRDRRRQTDVDYQRYLRRKEFNPMMHHVWLLKQKALLLGGHTNEAIKVGRTIEQYFAHDTTTLIQSRIISAVSYSLRGWIYAANNLLAPLQYRPDVAYISDMLRHNETYYLQAQERVAVTIPSQSISPSIQNKAVADHTLPEQLKSTKVSHDLQPLVRIVLCPQTTTPINEAQRYEIHKVAMRYVRERELSVTTFMSHQSEVVAISSFASHEEASVFLSVLRSQNLTFMQTCTSIIEPIK
ncbi:MAG: hypothetical protein ACRDD6_07135 [Tannerellaceae bacterium]